MMSGLSSFRLDKHENPRHSDERLRHALRSVSAVSLRTLRNWGRRLLTKVKGIHNAQFRIWNGGEAPQTR